MGHIDSLGKIYNYPLIDRSGSLSIVQARTQRNYVACVLLVWVCLEAIAYQTRQTVYKGKHRMLRDFNRFHLVFNSAHHLGRGYFNISQLSRGFRDRGEL